MHRGMAGKHVDMIMHVVLYRLAQAMHVDMMMSMACLAQASNVQVLPCSGNAW